MGNELVKKEELSPSQLRQMNINNLKNMLSGGAIRKRVEEVLGRKSDRFINNLVSIYSSSNKLAECEPISVISAALISANVDLSLLPSLGESAVVPYEDKKLGRKLAQFQIMTKGIETLCMRSGQYKEVKVDVVYNDEVDGRNPRTGKVILKDFVPFDSLKSKDNFDTTLDGMKKNGIVGVHAYFKLLNGFEHETFMTLEECEKHGKRYSMSYRYDKHGTSLWNTNFRAMAIKTVSKKLFGSGFSPKSVEMETALINDQQVYDENGEGHYLDNDSSESRKKPSESILDELMIDSNDIAEEEYKEDDSEAMEVFNK